MVRSLRHKVSSQPTVRLPRHVKSMALHFSLLGSSLLVYNFHSGTAVSLKYFFFPPVGPRHMAMSGLSPEQNLLLRARINGLATPSRRNRVSGNEESPLLSLLFLPRNTLQIPGLFFFLQSITRLSDSLAVSRRPTRTVSIHPSKSSSLHFFNCTSSPLGTESFSCSSAISFGVTESKIT